MGTGRDQWPKITKAVGKNPKADGPSPITRKAVLPYTSMKGFGGAGGALISSYHNGTKGMGIAVSMKNASDSGMEWNEGGNFTQHSKCTHYTFIQGEQVSCGSGISMSSHGSVSSSGASEHVNNARKDGFGSPSSGSGSGGVSRAVHKTQSCSAKMITSGSAVGIIAPHVGIGAGDLNIGSTYNTSFGSQGAMTLTASCDFAGTTKGMIHLAGKGVGMAGIDIAFEAKKNTNLVSYAENRIKSYGDTYMNGSKVYINSASPIADSPDVVSAMHSIPPIQPAKASNPVISA